jgi:branched-chain amino acid transport system substrate-binding protein
MLSATGKADVEGTIATCPCAPATKAGGTFPADYKAKFNVDAGAYADVGYDLMNLFLEGISAGKTTRADMLAFINSYNKQGAVSGVTYSWPAADKGELDPNQVRIWAYQATSGVWAPKEEIPKA